MLAGIQWVRSTRTSHIDSTAVPGRQTQSNIICAQNEYMYQYSCQIDMLLGFCYRDNNV